MNITDYLLESNINDDVPVLITAKEEFSYGDLKKATHSLKRVLESLNLKPGDRVGILGCNSLFWVASYLAVMKIGAIAVPLATKLPKNDLSEQIKQTRCKVLCVEKILEKRYASAFPPSLALIGEKAMDIGVDEVLPFAPAEFDENQDAAWMLTSGTTGKPRIVRITHLNIQANTDSIIQYLQIER